jgi:hypothetical protein
MSKAKETKQGEGTDVTMLLEYMETAAEDMDETIVYEHLEMCYGNGTEVQRLETRYVTDSSHITV